MDMVSSKTVHIWMRLKKITESDTDASALASAPNPAPAPTPCYPALRVPPAVTRLTVYRRPQLLGGAAGDFLFLLTLVG